MKSTSVLLILLCALGIYVYYEKYAKFDYPGSKTPGTPYPAKVRNDFTSMCRAAFKPDANTQAPEKFRLTEEKIEKLCDCSLTSIEEKLSYKQYDELESKIRAGFAAGAAAQMPRDVRHRVNGCANDLGFEIQGAFF